MVTVLDSDVEEPTIDHKKEELLRLRSGSLLSDYVSKMNYILSLGITWMSLHYLALLANEANKVFNNMAGSCTPI